LERGLTNQGEKKTGQKGASQNCSKRVFLEERDKKGTNIKRGGHEQRESRKNAGKSCSKTAGRG